ncbi:MAG: type II toxin-antitoxin system Phd/YefM family antitoxin [Chloroflexota bacterium]
MYQLYQTISSGDIKTHPNAAFEMAKDDPVVVISKSTPKAVIVSPEYWNKIAAELERLRQFQKASLLSQEFKQMKEGVEGENYLDITNMSHEELMKTVQTYVDTHHT